MKLVIVMNIDTCYVCIDVLHIFMKDNYLPSNPVPKILHRNNGDNDFHRHHL